MRSEGFFTYSRCAYTNFLHEERKMRRLFFARRAYNTHFTRRVEKKSFYRKNNHTIRKIKDKSSDLYAFFWYLYRLIMSELKRSLLVSLLLVDAPLYL